MALPQLVKSGVSVSPVTFSNAEIFPSVNPLVLNQFVGVSDDNTVNISVIGPALETLALTFQLLDAGDAANIRAFFEDPLVNWGQEEFTYIDTNGVSHTCRYAEPQFVLPEESEGNFSWEIVFTKVG